MVRGEIVEPCREIDARRHEDSMCMWSSRMMLQLSSSPIGDVVRPPCSVSELQTLDSLDMWAWDYIPPYAVVASLQGTVSRIRFFTSSNL
jgi:hypothetical protein